MPSPVRVYRVETQLDRTGWVYEGATGSAVRPTMSGAARSCYPLRTFRALRRDAVRVSIKRVSVVAWLLMHGAQRRAERGPSRSVTDAGAHSSDRKDTCAGARKERRLRRRFKSGRVCVRRAEHTPQPRMLDFVPRRYATVTSQIAAYLRPT
jgi:hypothetical protein